MLHRGGIRNRQLAVGARDLKIGFVTEFDVQDEVFVGDEPHPVGGRRHQELWVPAADLESFNRAIIGEIRSVAEYRNG